MTTTVLFAGSTGMLGNRIADHLLDQPRVEVRLLLRGAPPAGSAKARGRRRPACQGRAHRLGRRHRPVLTRRCDRRASTSWCPPCKAVRHHRRRSVALARPLPATAYDGSSPRTSLSTCSPHPKAPRSSTCARRVDRDIDALPLQVVHVLNGAFMDLMLDPGTPGIID